MTEQAAASLQRVLRDLARHGRSITYRELAAAADIRPPHSIHRVTEALEELIRQDHAAGRPLLAALAVSKGAAGIPGPGFFLLIESLGRYRGPPKGPEAAACHTRELAAAFAFWGDAGQDDR